MDISLIIYLLVFGGLANMTPVLLKKIPFLDRPIDGGVKINTKRIFGDGKTWRGLLGGVGVVALIGFLIVFVKGSIDFLGDTQIYYGDTPGMLGVFYASLFKALITGYIGLGALTGDLVKSFFKRQLGIARGVSWFPFDQIDWIVGIILFVGFAGYWSFELLWMLPIGLVLHVVVKYIGHQLKLDSKPI